MKNEKSKCRQEIKKQLATSISTFITFLTSFVLILQLHKFLVQTQSPKDVLEKNILKHFARFNFAKFTGKHLCRSFIFKKAAGVCYIKIDSGTGLFL